MATGKITVTGTMETEADHAALVAKGDIKIHGNGPNSSKFQGLVYSESSIDIAKTQIIGAAVSKDSAGTTKLEDVRAISVPELTKIEFEIHATLEEAKAGAGGGGHGTVGALPGQLGILRDDGSFVPLNDVNTDALKALGENLGETDPGGSTWSVKLKDGDSYSEISSLPFVQRADAQDAANKWSDYVFEHRDKNVQVADIFQLDLNTLISLDVKLEMMYHTTVSNR